MNLCNESPFLNALYLCCLGIIGMAQHSVIYYISSSRYPASLSRRNNLLDMMLLLVFKEEISSFHNSLRFLGSFGWRTQYRPQARGDQHKILSFILRYRHHFGYGVLKNQQLITRTKYRRPVSDAFSYACNVYPGSTGSEAEVHETKRLT